MSSSSSSSDPGPAEPRKSTPQNKKLRVLILSLGGPRQAVLRDMFASTPALSASFAPPVFVPGIPSRSLRNRESFFRHCHRAGLLPEAEWAALQKGFRTAAYRQHSERFFECLEGVPVTTEGRRGSEYDVSLHYSVELWRKAKTVNRGRAVLACALAHLTALRRLVTDGYDVLLEDNVRFPIETVAERMRETVRAVNEWENQSGNQCHLRFFGWLGSTTNLQWIDSSHVPRTKFDRENGKKSSISCFPMPTLQDIEADLATYNSSDGDNDGDHHHGDARANELEADDNEDDERQGESNSNPTTTTTKPRPKRKVATPSRVEIRSGGRMPTGSRKMLSKPSWTPCEKTSVPCCGRANGCVATSSSPLTRSYRVRYGRSLERRPSNFPRTPRFFGPPC